MTRDWPCPQDHRDGTKPRTGGSHVEADREGGWGCGDAGRSHHRPGILGRSGWWDQLKQVRADSHEMLEFAGKVKQEFIDGIESPWLL
jgi:hypothetical protein